MLSFWAVHFPEEESIPKFKLKIDFDFIFLGEFNIEINGIYIDNVIQHYEFNKPNLGHNFKYIEPGLNYHISCINCPNNDFMIVNRGFDSPINPNVDAFSLKCPLCENIISGIKAIILFQANGSIRLRNNREFVSKQFRIEGKKLILFDNKNYLNPLAIEIYKN